LVSVSISVLAIVPNLVLGLGRESAVEAALGRSMHRGMSEQYDLSIVLHYDQFVFFPHLNFLERVFSLLVSRSRYWHSNGDRH
jgi:hypothetical protein